MNLLLFAEDQGSMGLRALEAECQILSAFFLLTLDCLVECLLLVLDEQVAVEEVAFQSSS